MQLQARRQQRGLRTGATASGVASALAGGQLQVQVRTSGVGGGGSRIRCSCRRCFFSRSRLR